VTELGLAVRDGDRVVGVERDPRVDLRLVGQEVRRGALAERGVRVGRLCLSGSSCEAEADDQCAAALDEGLARDVLLMHEARHHLPPFAITAAACLIAVRMRGYVPHRQRWPFMAVRI